MRFRGVDRGPRLLAALALVASLGTASLAFAQGGPRYVVIREATPYQSLEDRGIASTQLTTGTTRVQHDLPFTFDFFGLGATTSYLQPDGYLSFNTSGSGTDPYFAGKNPIPSRNNPSQFIAPFWSDLNSVEIREGIEGTSPTRIQWYEFIDFTLVNPSSSTMEGSFLVGLYEDSAKFEISYGGSLSAQTFQNSIAIVGYETTGENGDEFGNLLDCSISESCNFQDFNGLADSRITVLRVIDPELVQTDFEISTGAFPGDTVTATITLDNLGNELVGLDIALYVSASGVPNPSSDRRIALFEDVANVAGQTEAVSFDIEFQLPADVERNRRFYAYAELDPNDEFEEIFENDNVLISDEPNFGTAYDLELVHLGSNRGGCRIVGPVENRTSPGSSAIFEVNVANRGAVFTDPVEIDLWASVDDSFERNQDIFIGTLVTPALGDAPVSTQTLFATFPVVNDPDITFPASFFPICQVDPNDLVEEIQSQTQNLLVGQFQDRFTVTLPPLAITTTELPAGVVGQTYEATIEVTGGPSQGDRDKLTWSQSGLPEGLSLDDDGVIRGVPTLPTEGVEVTIRARDSGETSTVEYLLVVNSAPPLEFTTSEVPDTVLGEDYSVQLETTGGLGGNLFSLSSGELPPGIIITATGELQGQATERGTFDFSISAQDAPPGGATPTSDTVDLQITVTGDDVSIAPETLPNAQVDQPYEATIVASGGVAPLTWSRSTGFRFPRGLEGRKLPGSEDYTISGTPTELGSTEFEVVVTDDIGRSVSQRYTLVVEGEDDPVCPGDPSCPDDPVPPSGGDSSGGCASTEVPDGVPVALLWTSLALGFVLRRRR